jgi:hypothetical protein
MRVDAQLKRSTSPLRAYGQSRLFIFLVAAVSGLWVGARPLSVLNQWDALWFLEVAREGYPTQIPEAGGHALQSTLPFFPVFPFLIRIVGWLPAVSHALAGVAISVTAGAVAVVLLHRLALRVTDNPAQASRTVALFSFFPGSMVLSMPYSEAVMIALAAGCLLALLDERWLAAGLCAALATATRVSALALVPACLWQAVRAIRREGHGGVGLKPLLAPALAPLGTVGFFMFLWIRTGDPLAFIHAQQAWHTGLGLTRPFVLTGEFLRAPFSTAMPAIATISMVIAAVAGGVLARRRQWPAVLSVYTFSLLALCVVSRPDGLRPRDLLTAFPLFLAAADAIEQRWMRVLVPASGAVLAVSLVCHNLGTWRQP